MKTGLVFPFFAVWILLASCREERYSVEQYYSASERDTLLANLIAYVYLMPRSADVQTRHNPEYRSYYVSQLPKFRLNYYFVASDSTHYYYLTRPARSPRFKHRGVGGKFKMDSDKKITNFEEIFNTPVMSEDSLKSKGKLLFREMVRTGNTDRFLNNPDYIEWPDERLKYDKVNHEWRYKLP